CTASDAITVTSAIVIDDVCSIYMVCLLFSFFPNPAATEIYTLSLHDALPISASPGSAPARPGERRYHSSPGSQSAPEACREFPRSEEHTSELQSRENLVCRLLLEKKK